MSLETFACLGHSHNTDRKKKRRKEKERKKHKDDKINRISIRSGGGENEAASGGHVELMPCCQGGLQHQSLGCCFILINADAP